jgi:predicted ATPase/DNA-binding CsgD family transcriptional regulator
MRTALVGREPEERQLDELLTRAVAGEGAIVLLSGEAGVGKTRLAASLARRAGVPVLRGAAIQDRTAPYGPLVGVLRSHLQAHPGGLGDCGPLRDQLALLLPELGEPPARADRAGVFEALRCALAAVGPALVVLDDLQWSDEATLEVLRALAEPLHALPLLVLAAYRSDGLPRTHGVRRLRLELRRAGHLDEIALRPLEPAATAQLLASVLGDRPAPALADAIHDRTQGVPFFVEELAAALRVSGALTATPAGLDLAAGDEVPLPETVRDAVLIRATELSDEGRRAAEVAAVGGDRFDLALVTALAGGGGLTELLATGMVCECAGGGTGTFRHALAREAIYADMPWPVRRDLHVAFAEGLEAGGAPARDVAPHWVAARVADRAREALLRAGADSEAVHAHRDAAEAFSHALELWPEQAEPQRRAEALARQARCWQLAGELADAARAYRELVALAPDADAHRALASVCEQRGDREAAVRARTAAAEAFAATGRDGEAAAEWLALANQRRLSARHEEAIRLATAARRHADAAGRTDLRLRALGIEGMARAKHDDYAAGLDTVRGALALALEHDLSAVAAELYQRLSVTLYESADFPRAEEALDAALELCRTAPNADAVACVSCLAYVLRERGEWSRAAELCREMVAEGTAVFVAEGLLGSIHAAEGKLAAGRRLLSSCLAVASRNDHYNMTLDSTAALARVDAAEGDRAGAAARCRAILTRWEGSNDRHYALAALRWAAAFFAGEGDRAGAHACAEALSRCAASSGHADALAALAHALAEIALLEGDADTAAEQLARAVELHRNLDMPYERAQIELRAGVALAAAGERELALERLCDAYRCARRLGARPLAATAATRVSELGESVAARLGVRAEGDAGFGGLSRREREVMRLVAVGRTNREIAHDLFLSPRTVDMHVRNILRKLDCRSRVEAAGRARELGLVA